MCVCFQLQPNLTFPRAKFYFNLILYVKEGGWGGGGGLVGARDFRLLTLKKKKKSQSLYDR